MITIIEDMKQQLYEAKEVGASCKEKKLNEVLAEANFISGILETNDTHVLHVLRRKLIAVEYRYYAVTERKLGFELPAGELYEKHGQEVLDELRDYYHEAMLYRSFL